MGIDYCNAYIAYTKLTQWITTQDKALALTAVTNPRYLDCLNKITKDEPTHANNIYLYIILGVIGGIFIILIIIIVIRRRRNNKEEESILISKSNIEEK